MLDDKEKLVLVILLAIDILLILTDKGIVISHIWCG
jgi:hypothetical protein